MYTQEADSLGGLLFRNVKPGRDTWFALTASGETSGPITVHTDAAAPWDPSIYDQEIPDNGYTYLTTRDGTQLAIDVHPPTSPAGEPGVPSMFHFPTLPIPGVPTPSYTPPYPTLIEYSGYGYANPAGPENGIAVLANLMGFAVVDVNMRGTGCSGGAYDFFETLQNLDGYDVIETIAHQPWVLGNKVGMLGISYGAISQLFTAQTRAGGPRGDRAAVDDRRDGFDAVSRRHPQHRVRGGVGRTAPAERRTGRPGHGQAWATKQIEEGDQTCAANQALHGEAANLMEKIKANSTYNPPVADPLDPVTFVKKINVPTFMACQWEDEQTGGHCADLAQHFTGTARKWFTFTNGAHVDSLDPYTFDRLYDFLELYVAHQAPILNAGGHPCRGPGHLPGSDGAAQNRPRHAPGGSDPGTADLRIGARRLRSAPGDPGPVRQRRRDLAARHHDGRRSVPGLRTVVLRSSRSPARRLGPGISGRTAPSANSSRAAEGVDSYTSDANATPLTDYSTNTGSGGLWGNASEWEWNWAQPAAGSAVSYVSAPLTTNTTAIGGGAVHLWVKSSTPDVDFQATVSEVRPDGNETFVQDGWLRASERKLATTSTNMFKQRPTLLQPIPTFLASDEEPMPAGEFVPVTIPLYFEGHAYRAGSRIRVTIAAPNGTQPVWSFGQTEPAGTTATESIAFSPSMPSSLTLPIVPGVTVPTGLPACPSLRNEPCRPYRPVVNNGS